MDWIEIDQLRLRCMIGFSPHERKDKQDVVISLRLGTDMRRAGETDSPDDAFNYRTVTKLIIRHVESSQYYLVEKMAAEIARICVVDCGAPYVQVRVHKPGALRFSDSVGVMIERTPADFAGERVYLSLGSNIEPEKNIPDALALLRRHTSLLAASSIYKTAPQGDANQPYFWNMAAAIITTRTPSELKTDVIDVIERELGRVRDPGNKNAPRTIDLDISLWGETRLEYGEKPWRLPDPDIVRFAHVAIPLAELAPNLMHPTEQKSLSAIAAAFKNVEMERLDGALSFYPNSS